MTLVELACCGVAFVCGTVVTVAAGGASPVLTSNVLYGSVTAVVAGVNFSLLMPLTCRRDATRASQSSSAPLLPPPSESAARVWWPVLAVCAMAQLWFVGVWRSGGDVPGPAAGPLWASGVGTGVAWLLLVGE